MKTEVEEIRRRFPRIIMNLVTAIIFWIIGAFVPPTVSNLVVPGFEANVDFLVWIVATVVMAFFLIRALSDAVVLGDILTDIVVRRLGIKEQMSPKRAARDFIYIIIVILIVVAISPILTSIRDIGHWLATAVTYIGLGLIILLIYDIGRILYRIVEQKAESLADRLVQTKEKNRKK